MPRKKPHCGSDPQIAIIEADNAEKTNNVVEAARPKHREKSG
ncbi:hypothetical protein [Methylotuvimicrobium sp. KM2]